MGFEFKKDIVNLEIAGNKFNIELNEQFNNRCAEFIKNVAVIGEQIKQSKDDAEILKKSCDLCKNTINVLIDDESASDKIFKGRKDDVFEHMDVVMYILDEVGKVRQIKIDKINNFANKYSNRNKNKEA